MSKSYIEVRTCRVCGNDNLVTILNLGVQALTGVFPKTPAEDVARGPLELVKCLPEEPAYACGLVQLKHSYDPDAMYGMNYGYRSGLNASMVAHLRNKARNIQKMIALKEGDLVLDIGSNDSTFLQALWRPGLACIGVDPAGRKFSGYYPSHIQLIPDFFSADAFLEAVGRRHAKVVTSFSMFYDLEDPCQFMRDVETVLADDGVWVFEQSYLPLMIQRNSYDTICHEHLEYYTMHQIVFMAERTGFKIIDAELNDINGGSFSVVAAKQRSVYPTNDAAIDRLLREESDRGFQNTAIFEEFGARIARHRTRVREFLNDCKESNVRVCGYGASTKGNVLLQYCGITPQDMPYIAEVNPDKFGSYTPGTRIPIISEEEVLRWKPDAYLVLPWHFREFILRREEPFLRSGRKIVFPLPEFEIVSYAQSTHYW